MEYVAGGELFDHLVQKGRLRPSEARSYFRQIIFGVDYCHRFNICHRDLKPENLLLDGTKKVVKVADFGMAALQPLERMLETSCGSPHYASPEIVSGKSYKGSASDIWSCGIILFALLCGRLPFDDPNIGKLLSKVRDGRFEMPEGLEDGAKDLIWKMLEVDPEKRMKMPEIMRHPWFTNHGSESSTNPSGPGAAMLGTEVQLTEAEIDVEILKNLKSLWPENSSRHIVKQLTSPGSNWQKTFYSLLVQHRDNHSMDDEEGSDSEDEAEDINPRAAPPAPAAPNAGSQNSLGLSLGINVASAASGARPPSIRIQEQSRPVRTAEPSTATLQPVKPPLLRATTDQSSSPRPSRNPSPSPRTASATVATPATSPMAQSSPYRPSNTRAYSDAPRSPGKPPAGPRPAPPASPNPNRASVDVGRSAPSAYRAPPTPVQPSAPADLSRRMTSPSHRKSAAEEQTSAASYDVSDVAAAAAAMRASMASPTNGRRPLSVNAPSIAVPQVGDATVQRFFQEIAAELASIRAASPTIAQQSLVQHQPQGQSRSQQQQSRRISQELDRGTAPGQPAVRLAPSPIAPAPLTPDLIRSDEHNQFDDADEELAMYADQISILSSVMAAGDGPSVSSPYTPASSPLPPAYGSSPTTKPLSVSDKSTNANKRLSAHRAPQGGLFAVPPASPAPSSVASGSRPNSYIVNGPPATSSEATSPQLKQSGGFMKRRSLLGLRKQPSNISSGSGVEGSKRVSMSYDQQQVSPQERQTALPVSPAHPQQELTPLQSRLAHNASARPTRLQQRNPGLGLDLTQQQQQQSTQMQQQNATSPSVLSPTTPYHSTHGVPSTPSAGPSAKQSWFAGLFNWKATSLHLNSLDGFVGTQMEVKRLLLTSGAKVFIEDSEALGSWRCSMKDNNSKTLRFRIEFNISSSPAGSHGGSSLLASPALSVPGTPMSGTGRGGLAPSPALSSSSRYSGAELLNATGYSTKVTFTLEKGNSQAFKNMYSQLRRDWILDAPGFAGAGTGGAQYSPAMVGLGVNM